MPPCISHEEGTLEKETGVKIVNPCSANLLSPDLPFFENTVDLDQLGWLLKKPSDQDPHCFTHRLLPSSV